MMDCFAYRLGGGEHGAHALVLSQLHGVLPLCLFARTQDTCPRITMEAPNHIFTISVSQVLEEALTTSKVMTGRRLLDCGLSPGRRLGFFDDVVDALAPHPHSSPRPRALDPPLAPLTPPRRQVWSVRQD